MTMNWLFDVKEFWQIDPSPILISLPLLQLKITWYGTLFALGLFLSHRLFSGLWQQRAAAKPSDKEKYGRFQLWQESLFTWIFFAILLGARLGEVLFYEWPYYRFHPSDIPKVWLGGLSSHGALVGIFVAVFCFVKRYRFNSSFQSLNIGATEIFDDLALSAFPCLICIRLGNFINQEIVGTPAELAWSVVFVSPKDGSSPLPRHPVQLYEALAYLAIGTVLWYGRDSRFAKRPGRSAGLFLIAIFSARAILETWKSPLGSDMTHLSLSTGQLLSFPVIAMGIWLLLRRQS